MRSLRILVLALVAMWQAFSAPQAHAEWMELGMFFNVYPTLSAACNADLADLQPRGYSLDSVMQSEGMGICNFLYQGGSGSLPTFYFVVCMQGFVPDGHTDRGCSPAGEVQNGILTGNTQCCPGDPSPSNTGAVTGGEPIDVASGNVAYGVTDYSTAGQNPLQFVRYYNSRGESGSALGKNWRSNFDRHIQLSLSTGVTVSRETGQQLPFSSANGGWRTHSDIDYTLTHTSTGWTVTKPDDTVETYTEGSVSTMVVTSPRLISIRARDGYTQTLSYNASGQLAKVADSYGRTLLFSYTNGLLASVKTPDNTVFTYAYNAAGMLASVSSPVDVTGTPTYTYHYENPSLPTALTSIANRYGERINNWTYDTYARGLSSWQGDANVKANLTSIAYDDITGNRTVTNALGATDTYIFVTQQLVPKVVQINRAKTDTTPAMTRSFSYDGNGYLATASDWNGNRTVFYRDAHGQPTYIVEGASLLNPKVTGISYDKAFPHQPARISTSALTADFVYDGSGNLQTETLTDISQAAQKTRTWTFYHDPTGLLLAVRNPRRDVNTRTTFDYGPDGALTAITDALGHIFSVTEHTGGGFPQAVKDFNGIVTRIAYDGQMRVTSKAIETKDETLTTLYAHRFANLLEKITLPDGSFLSLAYDSAQRPAKLSNATGDSIIFTLDALGNVTARNIFDSHNTLTHTHSSQFDALGRMLADIGGMGQTTAYTYDNNGNATLIIDPLKHQTWREFDPLNRLTGVKDAAGGFSRFSYDPYDRPLTVADPNGNTTSFAYDGFGNMIRQTNPDSGTTGYSYDEDGNLTSKTDAAGNIANYAYDALDRLISTTYPGDSTLNVSYYYDEPSGGFGIPRLTSLTDAAGSLSRKYDERGNLLSEQRTSMAGQRLITSYAYDKANRISLIIYPSGATVSYNRDRSGNVTSMPFAASGSGASSLLTDVSRLPFGPVNALSFYNGDRDSLVYDLDYRLTGLRDSSTTVPIPASTIDWTYSYDGASNVTSITDNLPNPWSQTFGYDMLNRLTSASSPNEFYGTIKWSYDNNGNLAGRSEEDARTYTYQTGTNRLAAINWPARTRNITYTETGNILDITDQIKAPTGPPQEVIFAGTYNKANRLATGKGVNGWTSPHVQFSGLSLVYDAFGKRFSKTSQIENTNNSTTFIYDQEGSLIEENDNGTITDYIYLDGINVGNWAATNHQLYAVHTDRLGAPLLLRDADGIPVWKAFPAPYGVMKWDWRIKMPASLPTQHLRFAGQYFDRETGFHYNMFRDYIPGWFDRYMESDPIGVFGGLNVYRYANDNPGSNTDRNGLEFVGNNRNPYDAIADRVAGIGQPAPPGPGIFDLLKEISGFLGDTSTLLRKEIPGLSKLDVFLNEEAFVNDPSFRNGAELTQSVLGLCPPIALGEAIAHGTGFVLDKYLDWIWELDPSHERMYPRRQ